jgi:hypothetical protein
MDARAAGFVHGASSPFNTHSDIEEAITTSDPIRATTRDDAEQFVNSLAPLISPSDLFDTREFGLGLFDANYKLYSDAGTCVYPESYLRTLAGGEDECGVLKPGGDESEGFGLPFLALSGWALVILAAAGLHYAYGNWRVRRWRRRLLAQGIVMNMPNRRRIARSKPGKSSSRAKSPHRRYAG